MSQLYAIEVEDLGTGVKRWLADDGQMYLTEQILQAKLFPTADQAAVWMQRIGTDHLVQQQNERTALSKLMCIVGHISPLQRTASVRVTLQAFVLQPTHSLILHIEEEVRRPPDQYRPATVQIGTRRHVWPRHGH